MMEVFDVELDERVITFIIVFFIGGIFAPWYGQYTQAFFDALIGIPLRLVLEFVLNGLIADIIGIGLLIAIKLLLKET